MEAGGRMCWPDVFMQLPQRAKKPIGIACIAERAH